MRVQTNPSRKLLQAERNVVLLHALHFLAVDQAHQVLACRLSQGFYIMRSLL